MNDVPEFRALSVTLIIWVEPVLEPCIQLIERQGRKRVVYDDIVPLKLLYQEVSTSELTRNRLEPHNVRRKLGGLDFPIVLDKVDTA